MKRHRSSSSSDSSDNESPSTSFCSSSQYGGKGGTPAVAPKKPAEVFRKDLISAMKLPDSHHIPPEDYYLLMDTWKQEWEKGVQVPAYPDGIPQPSVRIVAEKPKEILFSRPRKYIQVCSQEPQEPGYVNILELAEAMCRYDLDDMDLYWLEELNAELRDMGEVMMDELTLERAMEALERQCHDNMNHAIETEEGLGIEYDEDVVCDVCRSPDSEEGNDMVFCDKCNICVHQACYGIVKVPEGCWLCRTCVLGINPQCILCPKKGGAMKATRAGTKWAHVSCALWIPEVSIACPERMEPITKVSHIPPSRWSLICSLCKLKTGACIQCSVKSCTIPFHVTCAFEHSLEMKTILDEGDEVKFKSYCLKHSKPKAGEAGHSPARHKPPTETEKLGLRAQKLQELEEEFYAMVRPEELAQDVGLPQHLLDFVFQYWKLKRKSNFNKVLLPPREEEENLLVQPKEDSIRTRMRMFMYLRQDLERVRNLCYMVTRREKLKLSHSKVQEQVFNLQVQLIDHELSAGKSLSRPMDKTLSSPPRITLKLKMPKGTLGNGKSSFKSGNKPLCPDNSENVFDKRSGRTGRGQRAFLSNGLPAVREGGPGPMSLTKPSGKPLALQAALHGHSANGSSRLEQEQGRSAKSNGVMKKSAVKDSCQVSGDQDTPNYITDEGGSPKNLGGKRERMEGSARVSMSRQGQAALSDGYCPDLEHSDSEPEAKGRRRRARAPGGSPEEYPTEHYGGKGGNRSKLLLGSRISVQRS
ncbi:protein Jade-3-like isoform X2 [Scleropages formosus]|uniref:Jade family PHD finger 3 n=1 Tax=Scleropages formosus TaxID=113540 RepID=A0A8C9RIM1_SCLFO|nr:protein Jade-3-like isoform X2 [Scleropages formosus]